ncbi:unnamed protein product [Macrosiphum euphorbiae]|uniref:DUF4817 domain-containing protein n=1 Tax=Macrosiphum euphorbiae TaxID=13131 RepID=A0AAV0W6H2_9HEMI|nr:unnamed protein product [Macrosiphum euphorbiae]
MERFTVEQRVIIVKIHYKCGECVAETLRKLRTKQYSDASDCRKTVEFGGQKTQDTPKKDAKTSKVSQLFRETLSALVVRFHYCYALFNFTVNLSMTTNTKNCFTMTNGGCYKIRKTLEQCCQPRNKKNPGFLKMSTSAGTPYIVYTYTLKRY